MVAGSQASRPADETEAYAQRLAAALLADGGRALCSCWARSWWPARRPRSPPCRFSSQSEQCRPGCTVRGAHRGRGVHCWRSGVCRSCRRRGVGGHDAGSRGLAVAARCPAVLEAGGESIDLQDSAFAGGGRIAGPGCCFPSWAAAGAWLVHRSSRPLSRWWSSAGWRCRRLLAVRLLGPAGPPLWMLILVQQCSILLEIVL